MKIITVLVLLAALFAIAGTAFFQLFVLLASSLFFHHNYNRHIFRRG
ncbi:hypothetical protein [Candidatus Methylobacter oryzae]|nr:hypothetical protein [Candidatus Methylobacter oryzae]